MSQWSPVDASVRTYYLKLPYRLLAVFLIVLGFLFPVMAAAAFGDRNFTGNALAIYLFALVMSMMVLDLFAWIGYRLWRICLLVSPQGIAFRAIGYTIQSTWNNVASLENVSTPRGPQLGLVLNESGLDMSGWASASIKAMPALIMFSLLRGRYIQNTPIADCFIPIGPFQSDQLLADLHRYAPQISPAAVTNELPAAPPIDQSADLPPRDRANWPLRIGVLIGMLAFNIVFVVLGARAWQGGIYPFKTLEIGEQPIGFTFTRNGQTLLVATSSGQLQTWGMSDGTLQQTRQLPSSPATFAVSADGQLMAAGMNDSTVQIWHGDGTLWRSLGQAEKVPCPPCGSYPPVAFAPDNQSLASGSANGTIHVWRLNDGREILTLKAPSDENDATITSVAFSPDGQTLAAGAQSLLNSVQIWRLDTGALLGVFPGQFGPESSYANDVTFASDGKLLAVSTLDHGVWLIRPDDGGYSGTLEATNKLDRIDEWMAAFSPDGHYVASVTNDGALQIWRLSDNALLHTLRAHTEQVRQVAFSPDGRYLATGSFDDTVRLWQVTDVTR